MNGFDGKRLPLTFSSSFLERTVNETTVRCFTLECSEQSPQFGAQEKGVLISIHPKPCCQIANGKKVLEIRTTKPKLPPPFRSYIYCTRAQSPVLLCLQNLEKPYFETAGNNARGREAVDCDSARICNGRVIGEFVCDYIVEDKRGENIDILCTQGCLTLDEVKEYGKGGKTLYGFHIAELQLYPQPAELSRFRRWTGGEENEYFTRAPQSWAYAGVAKR